MRRIVASNESKVFASPSGAPPPWRDIGIVSSTALAGRLRGGAVIAFSAAAD